MTDEASYREIDRWERGVGWIAYPKEKMQRASHILETEEGSWIIDPVDTGGLDELIGDAEVKGVVTLLDRHKRDAAAVANRYGVSVHLPSFIDGVASELGACMKTFDGELGDTGYGLYEVVNNRFWQEAALYSEETNTLYVPEAVGTAEYFRTSGQQLGVHPMLRLKAPEVLRRFRPERIMVGHGEGVSEDATEILRKALENSRRKAPGLYLGIIKSMIFG